MKNMWKRAAAAVMLLVCGLAAGCGNTQTAGSQSRQGEQKVVVYMPSPTKLADQLAAGFTAKTGIKVEQFQGTTGQILARMEAEKSHPQADVVILASWSDGMSLKKKDLLLAYEPKNVDLMPDTWKDDAHMMYGTSASAVGVIYNTAVFPQLNADWGELASDPAYQNQMVIPDPKKSGSCKDFIDGFVTSKGDQGWSVLQGLFHQGMEVRGANKAALQSVLTGEKGILIAGVDYNAFEGMKKGEPIAIYYPQGGTVVNPRPAMIMKAAPDQENAKKFMDYLLSDEAQKMVEDAYLLPGRTDIKQDNRTALSEIAQIHADWDEMEKQADQIMKRFAAMAGTGR